MTSLTPEAVQPLVSPQVSEDKESRGSGTVLATAFLLMFGLWAAFFALAGPPGYFDTVPWKEEFAYGVDVVAVLSAFALIIVMFACRVPGVGSRALRAFAFALATGMVVTQLFLVVDLVAGDMGDEDKRVVGVYDSFLHAETFGVTLWFVSWPLYMLFPLPRGSPWWALARSIFLGAAVGLFVGGFGTEISDIQHRGPFGLEGSLLLASLLIVGALPLRVWQDGLKAWSRGFR
jgi:hypothetical protein